MTRSFIIGAVLTTQGATGAIPGEAEWDRVHRYEAALVTVIQSGHYKVATERNFDLTFVLLM